MRDPYEVLQVARNARPDEIRAAFRRRALHCHPDRNRDNPEAARLFKEINQAYQVLSDPKQRARYDRWGAAGVQSGVQSPSFETDNLEGFLGDFLGFLGLTAAKPVRLELHLSFEEAARGCQKEISYEVADLCPQCQGGGGQEGASSSLCEACAGRGRMRFRQGVLPLPVERRCSRCLGRGRVYSSPCGVCSGEGLTRHQRTIEVAIPPGLNHGDVHVVAGKGSRFHPLRSPGDVELKLAVGKHPHLQRRGDNVRSDVVVTVVQAILGGEVSVPTLDGSARLRIPQGTQPGTLLRLRGLGFPRQLPPGRGDHLVEVVVELPEELSERARGLLEALGQELGESVNPQPRTFADKLRNLWK